MDVIQGQSSSKRLKRTYYGWDGQKHPYPPTYEELIKDLTDKALADYNSKHDHRFELVEYLYLNCVSGLMDPTPGYNHLSFIAKTVDPPHKLKLFFAEVHSVRGTDAYKHYVKCCTPVDPDTPFFRLGCGSCNPGGVIYHPLRGYNVGGSCDNSPHRLPLLRPAEESAKKLLSGKYTFKSSNQYLPPDEDKELRKIVDGYAREALTLNCAFKLVKVVKAVRFSDFKARCFEDAVAWVHMLFLAKDIFCEAPPELFFAEFSIDRKWVSTCVRMTKADLGSKAETSCCTLCRKICPMIHPKGEYCAGNRGGSFVDALNEQRSWGMRVYLEEKQPLVATHGE